MMKKKGYTLTMIIILLLSLTSCMLEGIKGQGEVVTQKRKISNDFIRVVASRGLDVQITNSRNVSLEVEADQNLHHIIKTEVSEGTLIITATQNIIRAKSKKIHLSVPHINEIKASSGAEIMTQNIFKTEQMQLFLSSGAEANLELAVKKLVCKSSSGSDIILAGKADRFEALSTSGSDIEAYNLITKNCSAVASSGSDIKIYVTDSFTARASSGGDIRYKGNPTDINQNDASGGTIKKVNG